MADTIGLAIAIGLSSFFHKSVVVNRLLYGKNAIASKVILDQSKLRLILPLIVFPPLATIDLVAIYREMKSVELKTMNKERAEIAASRFVTVGEVPTPKEMSKLEHILRRTPLSREHERCKNRNECIQLKITSLRALDFRGVQWDDMTKAFGITASAAVSITPGSAPTCLSTKKYILHPQGSWLGIAMAHDADGKDYLSAILQGAHFRRIVSQSNHSSVSAALDLAMSHSRSDIDTFVTALCNAGYQIEPFLLAAGERNRWKIIKRDEPTQVMYNTTPTTTPTPSSKTPVSHVNH